MSDYTSQFSDPIPPAVMPERDPDSINWSRLEEKARSVGVDVFYDGTRYLFDNGRDYVPMDARSLAKQLDLRGISPAAEYIAEIQTNRFIKYAGPLAGRKRGIHESNGDLLLATSNPRMIRSSPCDWQTIKRFIAGKGNADKSAVIAAVRERGFSPADDNEADAIAILLWALETRGGVR